MGGFGWQNPFPLEFGGAPSPVERVYQALRSAVGKGGSAADDSGIEGLWRQVRATAIAAVTGGSERVALQVFPGRATVHLQYFEELLHLVNDPADTETARRAAASRAYTLQLASALPDIQARLQDIDERFRVLDTEPDEGLVTVHGRAFGDLAGAEPFVPDTEDAGPWDRTSTAFPNYADEFIAYVLLDIGGGVLPTAGDDRALGEARRLLHDVLPGHNDIVLITAEDFECDWSLLDITGLG